jgi:cbb3-type cytochrome oxidase subunit 3
VSSQKVITILKIAFAIAFLCIVYIYKERELQQIADEQRQKYFLESEARQDALDEELRPYIERNKRINAASKEDNYPEK